MANIPEEDCLRIEVWDRDLFRDEIIGSTSIDLSDRYFSERWLSLQNKPIEQRSLFNDWSQLEQGKIQLFLEIYSGSRKKLPPQLKINPQPREEFEVRLVVWTTEKIPKMDFEGTTDI